MNRGSGRAFGSAMAAWQTSLAAVTTISARMPILVSAAMTGSPKALRETQRMFSEKAAATIAGGLAARRAWFALCLRMSSGQIGPVDFHRYASSILDAAVAPAHRTCRANARRLTRKPKRRRP